MSRLGATLVKAGLYGTIVALFAGSLLAIGITGPVVVRVPKLEVPVEVSAARLRRDVDRLVGEFSPRSRAHPETLGRAAEWIGEEFRTAGLAVEFQEYDVEGRAVRNVIGHRAGLEHGRAVRVIGAHYDAFGERPGADDNASGVAVLLELVRTLMPDTPRRGQFFVACASDIGSRHFGELLRSRGVEVELLVALDQVGYYTDRAGSQRFPIPALRVLYPTRGDFVAVVGDLGAGKSIREVKQYLMSATDLPVHSFRGPARLTGRMASDHGSFRELGLPAVLLTDTAFLRHPDAEAGDTPDALDYDRMARLVRGLHGMVWDRDIAD